MRNILKYKFVALIAAFMIASCENKLDEKIAVKVYKILTVEEWQMAQQSGEIITELDQRDGFIHLSTANQLAGTLSFYFDRFENLILLEFETLELGDKLIFEETIPKGERVGKFPHYYAELETKSVSKFWEIKRNGFLLPKEVLVYSENFKT